MSVSALAGLAGVNVLYLVVGATFLWLVRSGPLDWIDVARLAGLAYIVGVAVTGSVWALLLISGTPFSLALVLGLPALLTIGFIVAGRRYGRTLPRGGHAEGGSQLIATAVGVAAAGVLLEGLFRRSRLAGLYEFDGWSFWVPKAKAIYEFGGLDEAFFTSLPGAAYPPLVPTLDAAVFHTMGSADVVTLHVQYWLFAVGLVWALAGLLAERVPPWMLWPFVLLLLLAPRIGRRFEVTEADLFLDYLFVLAALLLALWIIDSGRWRLVAAAALLCAAVNTKREGLLFATALILAALVTTVRERRARWPAIGGVALVTAIAAVPWRVWYVSRGVEGETGSHGLFREGGVDLLWPSVKRSLEALWDPGYWSFIFPLFLVALALAALARVGKLAVFFGTLTALVLAGGVWATWNFSQTGEGFVLGGNFVIRFMGAGALLCVAAAPLLLSAAWPQATADPGVGRSPRIGLATAIVAIPLLAYPAITLAVSGTPRFPTRDDCARPAVAGQPVEIVYGRFDSPLPADDLLQRVLAVGFAGTESLLDACGRWKVVYQDAPNLDVARQVQEEARTVGLDPKLERATNG